MTKLWLSLFAGLVAFALLAGAQDDVQPAVEKFLLGRSLMLRTPYQGAHLLFDMQGQIVGSSEPGTWSIDGIFFVEKVSLKKSTLELSGKRNLVAWRAGAGQDLVALQTERKIKVAIQVPPGANQDQVLGVLDHVFLGGDLRQRLENYWKPLVDVSQNCSEVKKQVPDGIVGYLPNQRPVYMCVIPDQVAPPKVLYSPDPEYGEQARKTRAEGSTELRLLINEQGLPELVCLTGINDEFATQTLLAVSRWKFRPATKEGVPVAVLITIHADFRPD